jgi:acetyl-CoA synthetase
MPEEKLVYEPSDSIKMKASIKRMEEYRELYQKSIKDPEKFWGELAEGLDWSKKWDKVLEWDFNKPEIKWFLGGKLNVSYNCLDRHLNTWRSNKVALIWQGEPLEENRFITMFASLQMS